jgi:hypothetical protein
MVKLLLRSVVIDKIQKRRQDHTATGYDSKQTQDAHYLNELACIAPPNN